MRRASSLKAGTGPGRPKPHPQVGKCSAHLPSTEQPREVSSSRTAVLWALDACRVYITSAYPLPQAQGDRGVSPTCAREGAESQAGRASCLGHRAVGLRCNHPHWLFPKTGQQVPISGGAFCSLALDSASAGSFPQGPCQLWPSLRALRSQPAKLGTVTTRRSLWVPVGGSQTDGRYTSL